jgi:hypothetical protein
MMYDVARWDEGADRARPEEEEFEENEYVILGCQRTEAGGDGGGEGGISSRGAPLLMPSTTAERVRPGTPQKRARPSLFHVFLWPTRSLVLFRSASYCA